jgi:hypothetical protein
VLLFVPQLTPYILFFWPLHCCSASIIFVINWEFPSPLNSSDLCLWWQWFISCLFPSQAKQAIVFFTVKATASDFAFPIFFPPTYGFLILFSLSLVTLASIISFSKVLVLEFEVIVFTLLFLLFQFPFSFQQKLCHFIGPFDSVK